MSASALVLSSLGGIVTFVASIVLIIRVIFKQVHATEENTKASQRNTEVIEDLLQKFNNHEVRITVLETRDTRRGH